MERNSKLGDFTPLEATPYENKSTGILYSQVSTNLKVNDFEKAYEKHLKDNCNLTNISIKLLKYLGTQKKVGDLITVNINEATKALELNTSPQLYRALIELLDANIIARSPFKNAFYYDRMYFDKVKKINVIIETILKEK